MLKVMAESIWKLVGESVAKVTFRDVLAMVTTIMLFALIALLNFHAAPETSRTSLDILVGAVAVQWANAMQFHFGSTAASIAKNKTIENLAMSNGENKKEGEPTK